MSELTKLLEGVKMGWQSLATVANIYDGTHQTPKYVEMGVPFVSVQNIKNLYATNKYISLQDFEKYKYKPQRGDIFMTRIGSIGSCAIVENDNPLAYYVTLTLIRVNHDVINSKYLKHIIESTIGQGELLKRTLVNATPIKINLGEIGKIQIPIPCPDNPEKSLKIQEEIVRILDRLSEETNQLTAALQKELEIHQKRYNFYREELFKFEGKEVEWRSLAEVFDLKNGYTPSKQNKEYWTNGTVPWFRMEDIRRNGRVLSNSIQHVSESAVKGGRLFPANSIIVATSATIGEYALITVPYLSNQRFTNLSIKNNFADIFIMKFMVHYSYLLGEWCKKNVTVGNFAGVDMGGFKKFPIAIPSLIDQERIVKILDELDTKTKAITKAIQKEIALRNKQYEYYRDRLLSFHSLQNEVEALQ